MTYSCGQLRSPHRPVGSYGASPQTLAAGRLASPDVDFKGGSSGFSSPHARRRRFNLVSMLLCVLLPWLVFASLYALLSFSLHYRRPWLCFWLTAACVVATAALGFASHSARHPAAASPEGRFGEAVATWHPFLFFTIACSIATALPFGEVNYRRSMLPYYKMLTLNNYTDVYVDLLRGQQLMDAGMVTFAAGTFVDVAKSMGFKNGETYCVAPLVHGPLPLATHDFWVVGVGCCSATAPDFHCTGYNDPKANGGFRILDDDARGFYRLAVQQAEATYHIRAEQPLFFEWSVDPIGTVDGWRDAGVNDYIYWVVCHLVVQTFGVGVAALAYSCRN